MAKVAVTAVWNVATPEPLVALRRRMRARPSVRAAMVYEGLLSEEAAAQ